MSFLDDILKKAQQVVGGGEQFVQHAAQNVGNYFNPTTINPQTGTNTSFWSTPAAQGLARIQQFNANPAPIHFNFSQPLTQHISNPVTRFTAQTALSIPETIANIPHDILQSGSQLGTDYRTGALRNPFTATRDIASAALPVVNLATLGGGSVARSIAGKVGKKAGYPALISALKQGAITGAKYGGGYGVLQGLSSSNDPLSQAENALKQGALGTVAGSVLGGATGGIANRVGAINNAFKKAFPKATPEMQSQAARAYARDLQTGRFKSPMASGKGLPGVQDWVRQQVGKNPGEPVFHSDLQKALQLSLQKAEKGSINFGAEVGGKPKSISSKAQIKSQVPAIGKPSPKYIGQLPQSKPILAENQASTKSISQQLSDKLATQGKLLPQEAKTLFSDPGVQDAYNKTLASTPGMEAITNKALNNGDIRGILAVIQKNMSPETRAMIGDLNRADTIAASTNNRGGQVLRPKIKTGSYTNVTQIDNRLLPKNPDTLSQGQPSIEDVGSQPVTPRAPLKQSAQSPVSLGSNFDPTTLSSDRSISQEPFPWETGQNTSTIPTDIATQTRAEANTLIGNEGQGGLGGLVPEVKNAFQNWVNARRASKVEGLLKNNEFKDLNSQGLQGIFYFQAGNKIGRFGDVKTYFDTKYKQLQDNGIKFDYKNDYLPQLWNNTPEEVQQVFGRSLGTKPSFTMESIIKNYQQGIAAGLKPKFNTIGDLAGWYEQRANKALADKQFFDYLGKSGFISSPGKTPQGWQTLSPDKFPKVNVNLEGKQYTGVYKAPPELAKLINNYLNDPQFGVLNGIANYVSRAKNITLSFGVPGTAINAHGINILARHTLFGTGGNPVTRFLTAGSYLLNQKAATNYLDKTLSTAPAAVKSGLTLSGEEHTALLNEGESVAKSLGRNWNTLFEKPLFNKMIPALKISSYNELQKNGMAPKDAAKMVNNVYGGINWEQMGRNKDTQNLFRSLILAPDWAETSLRLGGNLAKAFTPWGGETAGRYRTMAATLLGAVVTANITNKLTSGHYMYENDPGHTMEIQAGYTSDGQKRYLRPFGTAVDFVRLPYDIAAGLAKGDPSTAFRAVSNRLSIPLGSAMHLLTNTDYKGQPIYGKDKYGAPIPLGQSIGGIGAEAAGAIGFPSFAKNAIDYGTGKQGGEQALLQGLELPFRYQSPGNSKTQKFVGDTLNLSGQQLYDVKKKFQGEAPFSENQKQMIQQGGVKALDQIMQSRSQSREMKQVQDIQTKATNGEISPEEAQKSIDNILKTQSAPQKQSNIGGADKAFASTSTPTIKGDLADKITKNNVKLSGKSQFLSNGDYAYKAADGSVATIKITPKTPGTGINAFTNQNEKYLQARNVHDAPISDAEKAKLYQKLGVSKDDVRYDSLASHPTDIKTQYIVSKNFDHQTLLEHLLTGRVVSTTGTQFASNSVIDSLANQGLLSTSEAKALKAIKIDKNGNSLTKASAKSGSSKGSSGKARAKAISSFYANRSLSLSKLFQSQVKNTKPSNVSSLEKILQTRAPSNTGLKRVQDIVSGSESLVKGKKGKTIQSILQA